MRRLVTLITVVGSLAASDCGGGKEIKFADFQYQIACHEMHMCTTQTYNINDSDGNGEVRVNQWRISRSGANPSLAFNVPHRDMNGRVSISRASGFCDVTAGATMPGACTLSVAVGGSTFSGKCGSGAPSTAIPCQ